ncbi:G-protein coupled receptor GRL101-like isoform X2 [Penaeus japonicus]|uniref:G-protein coupled receptor GRL101-like isoform X2 n=1 Tax=Penaeus japonicus TaxID=27405 RepID=UPI001C710F22|nr:G-protein coupled receptor GRL101-like isoform X2 [Penaeus japonicus]
MFICIFIVGGLTSLLLPHPSSTSTITNTKKSNVLQQSALYKDSFYTIGEDSTWNGSSLTSPAKGQSCLAGEWMCADGSACIPENATCSEVPECADESDEAASKCGCLETEYECKDICIDKLSRCDNMKDCEDGEDEEDCDTWPCPMHHFKCNNSKCIPSVAVCNFVDNCGDGSDESVCPNHKCFHPDFRCNNGECIRPILVCDGVKNCIDGTDETECQSKHFKVCASGKRIHKFYWCDDYADCEDNHADELDCNECKDTEFTCPNNQCIPEKAVCDGQCDCRDCDDERDCSEIYVKNSGVVDCQQGAALTCIQDLDDRAKDRCIHSRKICDSSPHCLSKELRSGNVVTEEYNCPTNKSQPCKEGYFACKDGRCLPANLRCDRKVDCLHGDDELLCPRTECQEGEWQCESGQCIRLENRCDLGFHCLDKSDEMNCDNHTCGKGYRQCQTGQCLLEEFWCDHFPDCFDHSDEKRCRWRNCTEDEFACTTGHQCIPLSKRCVLSENRTENCADKSHFLDCRKSPACPPGMYRCLSGVCLDKSKQCNDKADCPGSWDDEESCPFDCSYGNNCSCVHLTANCSGLALLEFPNIESNMRRIIFADNNLSMSLHLRPILGYENISYLDLTRNKIRSIESGTFKHLLNLLILILSYNDITSLDKGAFQGLRNLRGLNLEGNQIKTLRSSAFHGLRALPTLDLTDQKLEHVAPRAFYGLRSLTTLLISGNQLKFLDDAVFSGLKELQMLDLSNNKLQNLHKRLFQGLHNLEHLSTDDRRWCCLAPHVRECLPAGDEFSSCEDLMSNLVLRVCIWILGFVALVGNSFVIIWRSIHSSGNKMHSFLIVNLGLGDLMMGVYLLIVAVVDLQYRGVYVAYELSWRSSFLCQLAGFISTFSSELSVFTLTVITVDRLIVIKFPFGLRRLEGSVTRLVMAFVWLVVILLAALPLSSLEYFDNFYGRSGVCLALHITNEKPNGWEYAVFIFLVLNLLSFGVIAVSYALMYIVARDTHSAAYASPEARLSDSGMATRMTLIVATDAACWLPIILLGIASLCGMAIPPKVFSWIAVFVLPLNAAINPVLYTLSTTPVRKRLRHLFRSFTRTRWPSFKSRLATDLTDLPNTGESFRSPPGESLQLNSKPSIVYRPTSAFTPELGNFANQCPLDVGGISPCDSPTEGTVVVNGGEDARLPLCTQQQQTQTQTQQQEALEPGKDAKEAREEELVPLEELTASLQGAKRNYGKLNRRKNLSNHRYD